MGRKPYTPKHIINKLRQAEVLLSQGDTVGGASKKIGVTGATYQYESDHIRLTD